MNEVLKYILFSLIILSSCKDDSENKCDTAEANASLIDIRDFSVLPNYGNLLEEVQNMVSASNDFNSEPSAENLSSLRTALKTSWLSWQSTSSFEFGPAFDNSLKVNINTFPADSASIVQRILNEDFVLIANDTKGFPALDLLLNGIGNNDAEILNYYTGENSESYLTYLNNTLLDIEQRISEVLSEWESGYGDTFVLSSGFSTGSSFSQYINAYIQDWEKTKRERIALPLGLLTFEIPLPERTEAYYGGYSTELALKHVQSHYSIYKSEGFLGLQELVEGVNNFTGENNETLDEAILAQFELSIEKLEQVPDPLSEAVISEFDLVNEAYLELQNMVVLLKTDVTSGLGVSINYSDNDGD